MITSHSVIQPFDVILENHAIILDPESDADAIIIDGSAIKDTLTQRNTKAFLEYVVMDVLHTLQLYNSKYQITEIGL